MAVGEEDEGEGLVVAASALGTDAQARSESGVDEVEVVLTRREGEPFGMKLDLEEERESWIVVSVMGVAATMLCPQDEGEANCSLHPAALALAPSIPSMC